MLTNQSNSVLNVKDLLGAFNQEVALIGAFSVIVKLCLIFENLGLKLYCPGPGARAASAV